MVLANSVESVSVWGEKKILLSDWQHALFEAAEAEELSFP